MRIKLLHVMAVMLAIFLTCLIPSQALEGRCPPSRPAFWDLKRRTKW